jgi:hypothetical protein
MNDMRFALLTLGVGLAVMAAVVLSDPLGIVVVFPLTLLVIVIAVAVYAVGKTLGADA